LLRVQDSVIFDTIFDCRKNDERRRRNIDPVAGPLLTLSLLSRLR